MRRILSIADFRFGFEGADLCAFIDAMPFFRPFTVSDGEACRFTISEEITDGDAERLSAMFSGKDSYFDVSFEDITCRFYRDGNDVFFFMEEEHSGKALWEKWTVGSVKVQMSIVRATATMYRYALWTAVNFLTCMHGCVAVHCSANVFDGKTAIFLGESGTGKSTHTRLLRERYPESFLLNDDSPFIRVSGDGKVTVYGSPWSGKTPCYKAEAYPLAAIVRLSQAPYNRISRLNPIQAIGALLPSAPPALNYTEETSDAVCNYISDILAEVPAWSLECLPNTEAAELSHDTIL